MGLPVFLRIPLGDVHVEVGGHLVDEADLFPGELAACAVQCAQMGGDVGGAVGIQVVGYLGEQPLRLSGQVRRVGRGFVRARLTQRRVAGEGVDVAFLDPVEAQTEQQILADQSG